MRLMAIAILFLAACAGSIEQRTRTTLDVLGQVVEPASKLALSQCNAQREDTEDEHKLDKIERIEKAGEENRRNAEARRRELREQKP